MSFKVVPAVYGKLGGFRPTSGRFQAPNLTRIPEKPLVSCLCVTENRHAFIPWLLWNYDRQKWTKRELVIVDSSEPPLQRPPRDDVRVIRVPLGTSLGLKRNLALEAARGEVVAWFDDDDWQHPKRLSTLVPLLREQAERLGASFIGPSQSFFLDVNGDRGQRFQMYRYPIFNGSVYYRDMVRHARFPEDVLRTEDTRWISTLLRNRQGAALVGDHPMLFFWLSHEVNITNRREMRRLDVDARELIRTLGPAWDETHGKLGELRRRLVKRPATRPVRDVLAEARHPAPPAPERAPVIEQAKAPVQVAPTRRKTAESPTALARISLYLLTGANPASRVAPDYEICRVGSAPFGWANAVTALAIRSKKDWEGLDYVGLLNEHAISHVDVAALGRGIENDSRSADVYAPGRRKRAPLRHLVENIAKGEELIRYLLSRLTVHPRVLARDVDSLEWGWLVRPQVLAEFVRRWLIPARTLLEDRFDPELKALLASSSNGHTPSPGSTDPRLGAILERLPSIACATGDWQVRTLEL